MTHTEPLIFLFPKPVSPLTHLEYDSEYGKASKEATKQGEQKNKATRRAKKQGDKEGRARRTGARAGLESRAASAHRRSAGAA